MFICLHRSRADIVIGAMVTQNDRYFFELLHLTRARFFFWESISRSNWTSLADFEVKRLEFDTARSETAVSEFEWRSIGL